MLNVILNETEILKKYQEEGKIPNGIKITDVIYILIKHYYIKGLDKKETYKNIMHDISETLGKDFIYTKWNKTVNGMVNTFYKNKTIYDLEVKLIDIKEIRITKNELDKISELDNLVLEKIAFIMLVYAKIEKIQLQNTSNEYWVNKPCSVICKEAKVGLKGNKQKAILNELYVKDYISMNNNNKKVSIKINYADDDIKESEDDLLINDFNGVIHQYLIWKGERWKRCEVCGKWIRVKGKERKKYCNACSKIKRLERQKKYMKNQQN